MLPDQPNSFLYRFSAINIFGFGLLAAAFHQGWVSTIWHTDSTHITSVIAVTFLLGLVLSFWRAWGINDMHNRSLGFRRSFGTEPLDSMGMRIAADLQIVQHIATMLLLLGIAGTMIGIIMALKSTEAYSTTDQGSIITAIVMLFRGVYVKFYASLVGIVFHGWLLTNYNMLTTMTRRILARLSTTP